MTIQVLFSPCLSSLPVDSARVAGHGPARFALSAAFILGDAGASVGFAALLFLLLEWCCSGLIGGEMIGRYKRRASCIHNTPFKDERQMGDEE